MTDQERNEEQGERNMSTCYTLRWKCRNCGICSVGGTAYGIADINDIMRGNHKLFFVMMIHKCSDEQLGIEDLIGAYVVQSPLTNRH